MNAEAFISQNSSLLKSLVIPFVVGGVGLIFLGYGLIASFGSAEEKNELVFTESAVASESAKTTVVYIDVSGAVVKPGVYKLGSDARVQDAVNVAGGFAATAERAWVAKNINLAAKLSDGAKIYIPTKLDIATQTNPGTASYGVLGSSATTNASALININTATASQLDTLSGVGAVTAEKIIQNRPYTTIEDLVKKNVLGQKAFDKIKDKIIAQ